MSVRTGEQTVRGTQLWKHRTGAGARNDDMDNTCELLINVVSASKPKMLTGLSQKARGVVGAFEFRSAQSTIPPADRQILSHRVKSVEHGKPDCLRTSGNRPARAGHRQAGMGGWKKRMPSCNEADRGSKFALTRKSADFQQVLNHEKGLKRCYRERTVRRQPEAVDGIPGDGKRWNSIIWKEIFKIVNRIQARIVKAVKAGDTKKVRGLQRLLRRSKAAKLMAVRRVTSNRGKKTPGIDNVRLNTPAKKQQAVRQLNSWKYKAIPLKRIYIPKKNKKKRPLGIPSMIDRCEQALEMLALDPISECKADKCSNGFRKKRAAHDAIEGCYNALRLKGSPAWILEADIKGCFDNISHDWIMENVPASQRKLRAWLKSGYLEKSMFYPTASGTPQGGIISPVLANMSLDGMEEMLKKAFPRTKKVHMVRYADDFIITGESKELLENKVKPLIEEFLEKRGLTLSSEKTKISHINGGFDFLGFNIRKYKGKLLTKPSKSSIASIKEKIRETVKTNKTVKTENLIEKLNPVIRGWGNYFRHSASKRTFTSIDHAVFEMTWKWAKRRHPGKSPKWIKSKYFQQEKNRNWVFKEKRNRHSLFKMDSIPIRRHIKIKGEANPYDPKWYEYFTERAMKLQKQNIRTRQDILWIEQKGICPACQTELDKGEEWHTHHLKPKSKGGKDNLENLVLIHSVCHRQIHANPNTGCLLPDASRHFIKA
ncbi:Group II intron reverse transcriptase/maturase [Desulfonema limicola]|uniref:Group II intron reverse transcriptase/maturase n=1 Tax=Desulfonema limicola TaxID=45656 RepID=A0A975BEH4_9BACT|nr:Group II intron reverse transcriptase/maturase [Desulfonema limicola]